MKILIIHTAFIGDVVLSTPLIRKIKEIYPDSKLDYLTTPAGRAILKNNPCLDEIISYDKHGKEAGIFNFLKLAKKLKINKYDMVVVPHRYLRSSLLAYLSKSKIIKGYDIATGSFLYTEKIKYNKELHEVEKLLSFFPVNNLKRDTAYNIELYPSKEDEKKIDSFIEKYGSKKIITYAPGSRWFTKKWPLENFNKVIEHFEKNENVVQFIVGGVDEKNLLIKFRENCIDLRGQTSLLELAEVLKKSDVVVTNDSSPIHIASAFSKPFILAIFGPTVKSFGFFPWNKNHKVLEVENLECRPCALHGGDRCPKGHFKCMLGITPEKVIQEIEQQLEKIK